MLADLLTEAELKALLAHDDEQQSINEKMDKSETQLLHALIRNQLRLSQTIEELQAELRQLKSELYSGGIAHEQHAAGLEPLPLPFMKQTSAFEAAKVAAKQSEHAPTAETSRKERYKRKSFW